MTDATTPPGQTGGWHEDLYTGAAGIALLHIEYAHAGLGAWETAHAWAKILVGQPVVADLDGSGLHRGAPAVAFALHAAGRSGYEPALTALDGHIATIVRHRLSRAHRRMDDQRLPALREYDLISGLTGIGAYLLHRGHVELLQDLLAYLVRLTQPLAIDDGVPVPGWWTAHAPTDQPSARWSGGHANLGMAHGIAGPLALLSLAMRDGVIVRGQAEAIERICAWLDQWSTGHGTSTWWPSTVSLVEHRDGQLRQTGPGRPSWCYGTPGLVRAQQLAAIALGDPHRRQQAEQALVGCLADDNQLALISDASMCHGWSGLLQTAHRVAADADDAGRFAVPRLRQCLRRHQLDHGPPKEDGLLDGVAGGQLAIHAANVGGEAISGWDACLLLDRGRTPTLYQPSSSS